MAKLNLKNVSNIRTSATTINDNSRAIEAAIENTVSRNGTSPNSMQANLDLGGYKIVNLGKPTATTDGARLQDLLELTNQVVKRTHSFLATAGQTLIALPYTYDMGNRALEVFVNGVRLTETTDFTETTNTSLTLVQALSLNDEVTVLVGNSWNVVVQEYISVSSFGATGDGVTDDTAAINAAIQAAGGGSAIVFPDGTYRVTDTLNVTATGGVHLLGSGIFATTILFDPSTNNKSCIKLDRTGDFVLGFCTIADMQINTTNTSFSKIAIDLVDTSVLYLNSILINNWWGNNDSVGLKTRGRDAFMGKNVSIYATTPWYIGKNTSAGTPNGWLSADHFSLEDYGLFPSATYAPSSWPKASIVIEDGANISQFKLTGNGAMVGGDYGIYWNQGTATQVHAYHANFLIENLRTEQMTPSTGYSIYFNIGTIAASLTPGQCPPLLNLTVRNCELAVETNGLYLRNIANVSVTDTVLRQIGTSKCYDVADVLSFDIKNIYYSDQATSSQQAFGAQMYPVIEYPHHSSWKLPQTACWQWRSINQYYDERPLKIGRCNVWAFSGTVGVGGQVNLPCSTNTPNLWENATIEVVATVGSTSIEYGTFITSKVAGANNGMIKVSGTANAIVTDVAGSGFACYNDIAYAAGFSPIVKNKFGSQAYFTILVYGARSSDA